jgi:ligand-binding SRPBCC domain-containing protein
MPQHQTELVLDTPIRAAWDFLTTTANIPKIALPEIQLVIEDAPDQLELGSRIKFCIQVMGAIIHATHEIVEFEPCERYVEEQVEGSFASWRHEHLFRADETGGTVIRDTIDFERPGGLVGILMTEARVRKQLDEGFEHREFRLKQLLEAGEM